jgi:primary replicative DNA helicase (EC 3.6.1.-)
MMEEDVYSYGFNDDSSNYLPPQNIEAEEAILGGILIDPEAITRIADQLRPEFFYVVAHQEIYRACLTLYSQSFPTDLMSVAAWLNDHNLLEKVGGQSKLVRLCDATLSAVNIDYYAQIVAEKYTRRKLSEAGREIINLSQNNSLPLTQVLDSAEQKLFAVTQSHNLQGLTPAADILTQTFFELENRYNKLGEGGDNLPGLTTGFYDLDAMTQGFQPSDLIIIAGRPSMGKTAFGVELAKKIADNHKLPVAIYSLEMSKEQLVYRLLASQTKRPGKEGIDTHKLRSGQIRDDEWTMIAMAVSTLSEMPIYIDDTPNPSINELRSKSRRLQIEKGANLA